MSGGHTHQLLLWNEPPDRVNHYINFVDPTTGAHYTQTIQGTWSKVKLMMRKKGVMNTSKVHGGV